MGESIEAPGCRRWNQTGGGNDETVLDVAIALVGVRSTSIDVARDWRGGDAGMSSSAWLAVSVTFASMRERLATSPEPTRAGSRLGRSLDQGRRDCSAVFGRETIERARSHALSRRCLGARRRGDGRNAQTRGQPVTPASAAAADDTALELALALLGVFARG